MLNSVDDAYTLLKKLNAPEHLQMHVRLVGEAAEALIEKFTETSLPFDADFVRIGVAIHDVGKIHHTNELTGPGSEHEPEGEQLLLKLGVSPKIARCCRSHAQFLTMECSIEELIIALSDKLWKGKRVEALELLVIDAVAEKLGKQRWDFFAELDQHFETIADGGYDRLERSVLSL